MFSLYVHIYINNTHYSFTIVLYDRLPLNSRVRIHPGGQQSQRGKADWNAQFKLFPANIQELLSAEAGNLGFILVRSWELCFLHDIKQDG